jgi:putative transposase
MSFPFGMYCRIRPLVFFYACYAVSYCNLEEILAERGATLDYVALDRWVVKYTLLIAPKAQTTKPPTTFYRRIDAT